jgi:hypothetical protein
MLLRRIAMPMHDWTRVEPAIFYDFRHSWISEIKRTLNRDLPKDHYALIQQQKLQFDPNLPFQLHRVGVNPVPVSAIVVRRSNDDRAVAMVEVVSPGIKYNADTVGAFVDHLCEKLQKKLQVLLIDPVRSGEHDLRSIHGAIWEKFDHEPEVCSAQKPLSLAAYSSGDSIKVYLQPFAVGDELPNMPLFLEQEAYIDVPLERTYMAAWEVVPLRWRRVIDSGD